MKRKKRTRRHTARFYDDAIDWLEEEVDEDDPEAAPDPTRWVADLLERASRRARMRNRDLKRGILASRASLPRLLDEDDYPIEHAG